MGIEAANRCVKTSPKMTACYYYRAINTGLYHEAHIIGYQKGVTSMIADCEHVIALDRSYDHAGAYRILGQLYTKLPQTTTTATGVTRDLDKAKTVLFEAVTIAPHYPENHLFLVETLIARDEIDEAKKQLRLAKQLTQDFRHDESYAQWSTLIKMFERKLHQ